MNSPTTNDDLNKKQNSNHFIEYLLAQRQSYSSAKYWFTCSTVFTFIPIIIGIISLYAHPSCIYQFLIMASFIVTIICENIAQKKMTIGADIQQNFDTELFGITNDFKNYIERDEIINLKKKLSKKPENIEYVKNWYTVFTNNDDYPYPISMLKCQQQNLCWTKNLVKKQLYLLTFILLILFIVIVILSCFYIINQSTNLIWGCAIIVYKIIITSLIKHWNAKEEIQKTYRKYYNYLEKTDLINQKDQDDLIKIITEIQDHIYKIRKESRPTYDWLYWRSKNKEEKKSKERLEKN